MEICDYLTNSQKILFSHFGNRKTHVLISAHQTEDTFPGAPHTTRLHNLNFFQITKIPVGSGMLAGEWRLRQEEGAIAKTRWRHSCRLRCPPPLFLPKCSFLNVLLLASLPPARWNALQWIWDQENWWWTLVWFECKNLQIVGSQLHDINHPFGMLQVEAFIPTRPKFKLTKKPTWRWMMMMMMHPKKVKCCSTFY